MSDRLKTILWTIPVTLALIALAFGAWWLWVERPGLTVDSGAVATATPVTRYYAYVFGSARDQWGKPIAGVTVMVNGKSSTTNASGEWGVTPAVTVGETYYFEITIPDGWYLTQWPQSFVATEPPDPIGPFLIVLAPISTPQPAWTKTPVVTATRTATPIWTVTRTATIHPTDETPIPPTPPYTTPTVPQPPTPDDAPQWAVVSWWGQWGLVGERQPSGVQFLQVPREHWPIIRRAVYLAQGGALPQYDTWGASKLGYALAQAELGAVLTPPVVVECGDVGYLCVGTAAGILVVKR